MKPFQFFPVPLGMAIALSSCNVLPQSFGNFLEASATSVLSHRWLPNALEPCLPDGIQLSTVVSATVVPGTADTVSTVSVAQTLRQLQASCQQQRLVDATGRDIQFYRLEGCWGNPPSNYSELMQQQGEALRRLRERYTVIEITCNPSGIPYP
jgi:hypothetical protein